MRARSVRPACESNRRKMHFFPIWPADGPTFLGPMGIDPYVLQARPHNFFPVLGFHTPTRREIKMAMKSTPVRTSSTARPRVMEVVGTMSP